MDSIVDFIIIFRILQIYVYKMSLIGCASVACWLDAKHLCI